MAFNGSIIMLIPLATILAAIKHNVLPPPQRMPIIVSRGSFFFRNMSSRPIKVWTHSRCPGIHRSLFRNLSSFSSKSEGIFLQQALGAQRRLLLSWSTGHERQCWYGVGERVVIPTRGFHTGLRGGGRQTVVHVYWYTITKNIFILSRGGQFGNFVFWDF